MATAKTRTKPSFKAALTVIGSFVDSFKGVTMKEAREKLRGARMSTCSWEADGFGGKQLVATFATHEVRVMFHGRHALVASLQVLTD